MARSRRQRVYDALMVNVNDSPIFKELRIDWSKHSKVQKASRGIWEVQQEIFTEVKSGYFSRFSSGSSSLRDARLLFKPMLIGFLILSVIAALLVGVVVEEMANIWYWRAVLISYCVLAVLSALTSLRRSYFDLYPRAAWRYWRKVRKEQRQPINSIEAVDYLIGLLSKSTVVEIAEAFDGKFYRQNRKTYDGRHELHYKRHKEEALRYRDWLEENLNHDVHSQQVLDIFEAREESIRNKLQDIERVEAAILSLAKKMATRTFPAYKDELERISRSIDKIESEGSGNAEDLLATPQKKKSETEKKVITAVETLEEKFRTVLELYLEILEEKRKDRGESVTRMSTESLKRIQKMKLTEDYEVKTETSE